MAPDRGATVDARSVAADLAGLPQTPRLDERRGRVEPAATISGNRGYRYADFGRRCGIVNLTGDGVDGAGVRRVLELDGHVGRDPRRRCTRWARRAIRGPKQARHEVTEDVHLPGHVMSADTTVFAAVGGGTSDLGAASAAVLHASTTWTETPS